MEADAREVMVEATCLAWVVVDLVSGRATRVRIHGVPENIAFPAEPDVVTAEPGDTLRPADAARARLLARNARLPFPFELMV